MPKFENQTSQCLKNEIRIIKVVRVLKLKLVSSLLDYGVKMVHLVRDPRGIASSRVKLNYGSGKMYNKNEATQIHLYWQSALLRKLCVETIENLKFSFNVALKIENTKTKNKNINDTNFSSSNLGKNFITAERHIYEASEYIKKSIAKKWQTHYILARYEDLARYPLDYAPILYTSIGLETPSEIKTWIHDSKHLHVSERNEIYSMSTFRRNWTNTAFDWKNSFEMTAITDIQHSCHIAMGLLGYKEIKTENDLKAVHNNVYSILDWNKILKYFKTTRN